MSALPDRRAVTDIALSLLRSAPFSRVLSLAIIGTACASFALRSLIGWPGLIAALGTLVVISAASLAANRAELEWRGLLPVSLLLFLGWSAISVFWTDYQWAALGSIVYQFVFAFLGVYVALTRDLIQLVRGFGDVLRALLGASILAEVLSGIILDTPFRFLGITGALGGAGPIQGIFGTRNQLAVIATIALITFLVEYRTRSVTTPLAIGSLILGAGSAVLTRSPVAFGTVTIVAIGAFALLRLRRMGTAERRVGQFVVLGAVVIVSLVAFLARGRALALFNAGSEFEFRYRLWVDVIALTRVNELEGFGWIGYWRDTLPPYANIDPFASPHASALNAYLDVWLQVGLVGLMLFIALVSLAFVRSWLLGANKRSVVFVWPALVMLALVVVSGGESFALVEFGWFILVVCAVYGSHGLSWRARLPDDDSVIVDQGR